MKNKIESLKCYTFSSLFLRRLVYSLTLMFKFSRPSNGIVTVDLIANLLSIMILPVSFLKNHEP